MKKGKARSIGVSNFTQAKMESLLKRSVIQRVETSITEVKF